MLAPTNKCRRDLAQAAECMQEYMNTSACGDIDAFYYGVNSATITMPGKCCSKLLSKRVLLDGRQHFNHASSLFRYLSLSLHASMPVAISLCVPPKFLLCICAWQNICTQGEGRLRMLALHASHHGKSQSLQWTFHLGSIVCKEDEKFYNFSVKDANLPAEVHCREDIPAKCPRKRISEHLEEKRVG